MEDVLRVKEFREFCESKRIKVHLIAIGASRANGQVERVMGTLKIMFTEVDIYIYIYICKVVNLGIIQGSIL